MKISSKIRKPSVLPEGSIEVSSTSRVTADASPISLKQSDQINFRFEPSLLENPKNSEECIFGDLIFERKKPSDAKFPSSNGKVEKISRGSIKSGEYLSLRLEHSEVLTLYKGLGQLYDLYKEMGGIPYGSTHFARVDSKYKQFLEILQTDPSAAKMIGQPENYELVKILLRLITETDSLDSLKNSLAELEGDNLQQLTSAIKLEKLNRVAKIMQDNLDNGREEFWQAEVFAKNQWILAQIFSCPFTIFEEKAYVGGKSLGNKHGNECDFLYQNSLSQNIALIEIKTPCTALIGTKYRDTYSLSKELSGAVNQVLNYKDKLTKGYYNFRQNDERPFQVLSPKCVVVIGKIQDLLPEQLPAFENFRNNLKDVSVITFDELYEKINELIAVFSEGTEEEQSPVSTTYSDGELVDSDLPF